MTLVFVKMSLQERLPNIIVDRSKILSFRICLAVLIIGIAAIPYYTLLITSSKSLEITPFIMIKSAYAQTDCDPSIASCTNQPPPSGQVTCADGSTGPPCPTDNNSGGSSQPAGDTSGQVTCADGSTGPPCPTDNNSGGSSQPAGDTSGQVTCADGSTGPPCPSGSDSSSSNTNTGEQTTCDPADAGPPGTPTYDASTSINTQIFEKLTKLSEVADSEGSTAFKSAIDDFKNYLQTQLTTSPSTPSVSIVMGALTLWVNDPGNQWGEGWLDSSDLSMSAPDYATVPASQYKCNAYVAEVIYKALGITFPVYQASGSDKFFPYRARDWGDSAKSIPNFPVVTVPQMGDIWSDGHHTGIYLGQYNGIKVYISARDRGDGSVGIGNIQFEHGIQIKQLGDGGTFRHYTP